MEYGKVRNVEGFKGKSNENCGSIYWHIYFKMKECKRVGWACKSIRWMNFKWGEEDSSKVASRHRSSLMHSPLLGRLISRSASLINSLKNLQWRPRTVSIIALTTHSHWPLTRWRSFRTSAFPYFSIFLVFCYHNISQPSLRLIYYLNIPQILIRRLTCLSKLSSLLLYFIYFLFHKYICISFATLFFLLIYIFTFNLWHGLRLCLFWDLFDSFFFSIIARR